MISRMPFPRKYLTSRGVLDISDINPGDCVYEWKTNKLLEIQTIEYLCYNNMYEVTYSDGRIEYHTNHEPVYLEEYNTPPHSPFCKCRRSWQFPINLYPIIFDTTTISKPLSPDPYIAGALLIYGDQTDPYINYPMNRIEPNNEFSHKYNVDYYPLLDKKKAYLQWKGKEAERPITWEEFFPSYDFYGTNHNSRLMVPNEYLYAPMNDRTQFIRGVFDTGYIKSRSPYQAAIFHEDQCKMRWVQSILWSMGIPSVLSYNEEKNPAWCLEVRGKFNHYPGFFYYREYIEAMISADNKGAPIEYNNRVTIVKTRPLECCPFGIHNPFPHIRLRKPHMVYTSVNYLPRVSI